MKYIFDRNNISIEVLLSGKLLSAIMSQDLEKVMAVMPAPNAFDKYIPVFNSKTLLFENMPNPSYNAEKGKDFYEKFRERFSWGFYDKTNTFVLLRQGDSFLFEDGEIKITY